MLGLNRLPLVAAVSALFLSTPVWSQPFASAHNPRHVAEPVTGGEVNSDASIALGDGFTVSNISLGAYTVSFAKGTFLTAPVYSCVPYGVVTTVPICVVSTSSWNKNTGAATATFVFYNPKNNAPVKNNFEFIALALPAAPGTVGAKAARH